MAIPAIDDLERRITKQEREIRRLRAEMQRFSNGGRVRASSIVGTSPTTSGGTGITGSPLGVTLWKNASGGTRSQGYVCVLSVAADQSFDDTTTQADQDVIGVLDDDSIIVGAAGRIRHIGYQSVVNVQGNVAAGDYLYTSTTAGRAASAGTQLKPGCFGQAVTAYGGGGAGTVAAFLFPPAGADESSIQLVIDGAASVISTGVKADLEVPFDCTVEGWTLVADQSGSIVIDVWRDTFGNFPPVVGDSIAGTEKPTLSAAQTAQDLALSTWTTSLLKGDWLRFNVDSAATVLRVTLSLRLRKR